jgi:TolB-like protein/class 3 adenylate cyclase/tetratricopeptide (TPR) repeat protein
MGEQVVRRLAAILAADVVGYSRLMGRDENGTLARLKAHRTERLEPVLAHRGGRLVKLTGDGALVEFPSAVDALSAAIEFQQVMAEANRHQPEDMAIVFRIGLHVGDLIVEGDDLYGDGVNVAVRLEAKAPAGGIVVSRTVHEAVSNRLKATFDDFGSLTLKNIDRPVHVFGVKWEPADWKVEVGSAVEPMNAASPTADVPLALPDKPSIAILPFQNISGDPEQDYFADGLVEEIITALSSFNSLFVIARNSSFTYKGRAVDVKQVGRELGVRYVLEGSVRKAANQVRIMSQLIDASTGVHLWAQRFDGSLEDIFDLQDRITAGVVGPMAPRLERAEIERAKRKPTESLDAYDYYLRGVADLQRLTKQSNETALQLFYKAIEIDANFASALAMAARCFTLRKTNRWMIDPAQEAAEAVRLARRAIEVGKGDAVALCYAGYALVHAAYELESGAAIIQRAIVLNPHLAVAWQLSGTVQAFLGQPEIAIEHTVRAMRLSPLDPGLWAMQSSLALAYFIAGRYDEASSWTDRAIQEGTNFLPVFRMAVASKALAGRQEEARNALRRMLQIDPTARISNATERALFRRLEDVTRLEEGLRIAGLPE